MNIHLVQPLHNFVKLQDNTWESGLWELGEEQAKQLVGGEIYFHKKRSEPSFYGGTITGYRVHDEEGDCQGKIAFQLEYRGNCRNVSTDKAGWNRNIKIIEAEPEAVGA